MSIISKLFTVLASSALVFSGFSGVSAHAGGLQNLLIVNHNSGIFLRDKNCNKVGSLGYGNLLSKTSLASITCNINGQSLKFISGTKILDPMVTAADNTEVYVAEKYVSPVIRNDSTDIDYAKNPLLVKANGGLNIRNSSCKRLGTVPDGTGLTHPTGLSFSSRYKICKVQNKFYKMTVIDGFVDELYGNSSEYRNGVLFVAESFITASN